MVLDALTHSPEARDRILVFAGHRHLVGSGPRGVYQRKIDLIPNVAEPKVLAGDAPPPSTSQVLFRPLQRDTTPAVEIRLAGDLCDNWVRERRPAVKHDLFVGMSAHLRFDQCDPAVIVLTDLGLQQRARLRKAVAVISRQITRLIKPAEHSYARFKKPVGVPTLVCHRCTPRRSRRMPRHRS
jgi:hypothetical protein